MIMLQHMHVVQAAQSVTTRYSTNYRFYDRSTGKESLLEETVRKDLSAVNSIQQHLQLNPGQTEVRSGIRIPAVQPLAYMSDKYQSYIPQEKLHSIDAVLERVDDQAASAKARTSLHDRYDAAQSDLWLPLMALGISNDHPHTCFLPTITWKSKRDRTSDTGGMTQELRLHKYFEQTVKNCMASGATIGFAPLIVAHPKMIHAQILIIDTKQKTLERFDPNGIAPYGLEQQDTVGQGNLDAQLIKIGREWGLRLIPQSAPPIQLIESAVQGFSPGYCETWIFWYLELRLLNRDIDLLTLHRQMVQILEDSGTRVVQDYINAKLTRFEPFLAKRPAYIQPEIHTNFLHIEEKREQYTAVVFDVLLHKADKVTRTNPAWVEVEEAEKQLAVQTQNIVSYWTNLSNQTLPAGRFDTASKKFAAYQLRGLQGGRLSKKRKKASGSRKKRSKISLAAARRKRSKKSLTSARRKRASSKRRRSSAGNRYN